MRKTDVFPYHDRPGPLINRLRTYRDKGSNSRRDGKIFSHYFSQVQMSTRPSAFPLRLLPVYYKTRKFVGYGKLSKKNIDDLEAGHREIKVDGENDKADPFAEPTEQQFTELHRLFRSELRKKPYNYREKDFQQLYRQTIALSATLLRSCIVRAYNNGSIPGKK